MPSVPGELEAPGADLKKTLGEELDCRGLTVAPKLSLRDGADLTVKSRVDGRLGARDVIEGEDGRMDIGRLDLNDGLEGCVENDLPWLIEGLDGDTRDVRLELLEKLRARDGAEIWLELVEARLSAIRFTVALRFELLRPVRPCRRIDDCRPGNEKPA
jgi:hypothetical protein